ncbi:NADPH oxidase activator 1 isoform X8 [Phyllostomus hastatus]|uniref:NADPH oxidase activator 1 isoform X8 n=1 Tax=Phyllostomus hastatus TaxID=9423 RepID=UPI001E67F1C6|nr:NADPH oxidase activator 1 isoform X8 [Phyllostomus hastatus]
MALCAHARALRAPGCIGHFHGAHRIPRPRGWSSIWTVSVAWGEGLQTLVLSAFRGHICSQAFDQAVAKDVYLAVGFFQRGVANFQLERSQEALSDFQVALARLRGNMAIDYTQLGLRFKLQAWEVLFNVAAAQCRLGLWAEAARSLEDAVSKGPEGARRDLDAALARVQEQGTLQPRSVPRGEVFRPLRRYLEHLKPMDFLGKAKVVMASGTGLQQPQVPDQGRGARPRAGLRAHDTGPCGAGAGTPLGPGTPPSTVTEVGSGRAGRAEHRARVSEGEQRPPPEQASQQAPVGSGRRGPHALGGRHGAVCLYPGPGGPARSQPVQPEGPAERGPPCPGAVRAAQVGTSQPGEGPELEEGRPHRGLRVSGIRSSPTAPARAGRQPLAAHTDGPLRSYREPGGRGRWVPLPEERALQRAWRDAASGPEGLQLRCRAVDGRPVLCQVVARHSYSAQRPEDLDPQPGDTVDVLCGVDQAWLEGHCDGRVGIFPKCFVVPAGHCA